MIRTQLLGWFKMGFYVNFAKINNVFLLNTKECFLNVMREKNNNYLFMIMKDKKDKPLCPKIIMNTNYLIYQNVLFRIIINA